MLGRCGCARDLHGPLKMPLWTNRCAQLSLKCATVQQILATTGFADIYGTLVAEPSMP